MNKIHVIILVSEQCETGLQIYCVRNSGRSILCGLPAVQPMGMQALEASRTCASEHFSPLTLGSFNGLVTDFNGKDEPALVGLRGRENVFVEGMSSGTRDQLYLALSLASLERYMESAESMLFIVDDVLVDFDDVRSKAALREMSELSKDGQVILFTHHEHVVEQAQAILPNELTTIHNL